MSLFPLGIQGTLSPLGISPAARRREQVLLWVHTLEAAPHRIALERLAIPPVQLMVMSDVVKLHCLGPLLDTTTQTHSVRLFRSEPGNDDPC